MFRIVVFPIAMQPDAGSLGAKSQPQQSRMIDTRSDRKIGAVNDENYRPTERRPLASRQLASARKITAWLVARNISPNSISLAGVAFSLFCGLCCAGTNWTDDSTSRVLFILAAVFIQTRLLANLFDGMVAVASGKASRLGEVYNEVPDRVSDPLILIGTGFAAGGSPSLGFVAAVLSVLVAYLRVFGNSIGARDLFLGPMAKQQRMATLTGACIYCALVPAGWFGGLGSTTWLGATSIALALITLGSVVTAGRRLQRIAMQIGGN